MIKVFLFSYWTPKVNPRSKCTARRIEIAVEASTGNVWGIERNSPGKMRGSLLASGLQLNEIAEQLPIRLDSETWEELSNRFPEKY